MEPPPPSYDDVLNAGSSIIVSPTENPPTPPTPTLPPPIAQSTPSSGEPSQSQRRMSGGRPQRMPGTQPSSASMLSTGRRPSTSQQRSTRQVAKPQPRGVFDRFATFSMPNVMMAGMSPPKIDAELDIEAHLPNARREQLRKQSQRHMRLKCCCGFMWCIGFAILFCFVALPVAMILTGVFGMSTCPIFGNLYIIYMIVGGSFLALTVCLRLLSSGMTCCKITNCLNTERSDNCTAFIVALEVVFCLLVVINIVVAFAGAVWVGLMQTPGREEPASANDLDFCSNAVFYSMCGYIGGMGVLGLSLGLYLLCGYCCYVKYKPELAPPQVTNRRQHHRHRHQQQQRTSSF